MEKSSWVIVATTLITVAGTITVALINRPAKVDKPAAPAAESLKPATIDGTWRDQFDARFVLVTDGPRLKLSGVSGTRIMQGTGSMVADRLVVAITNTVDKGTISCDGVLVGTAVIQSSCVEPDGNRFDWRLERLP